MKKRVIVIMLVLAIVFSLAACGGGGTKNTQESSAGGIATQGASDTSPSEAGTPASGNPGAKPVEITVALIMIPNGLDPLTEDAAHNFSIVNHVYDTLVGFEPLSNEWLPAVATSWEPVDSSTWKFEINLDYTFSNGDRLSMDDVVFSLLRLRDNPKTVSNGMLIDNVTYDGNVLTLKFVDSAIATPAKVLSTAVIVNKAYVENGGDDAVFMKPIGTGPYRVTDFVPGTSATIELWDGYPFERPQIDKINFIGIMENATRYIALETGRVQYAGYLTSFEYQAAMDDNALTAISTPSKVVFCFEFNCEAAPLDDVNVRRALTHALDKVSFRALQGGRPAVDSMLFVGYDDWYVESSDLPDYNIDTARALLEEAGYNESNPLRIDVIAGEPDPGLEMYKSTLETIGVDLSITYLEPSVFIAREGAGEFYALFVPMQNQGKHAFTDLDRFDIQMKGQRNGSRYYNERAQELIETMRVTRDQQELKAMVKELNDIISYEVPMVGVMLASLYTAVDSKLTGVVISGDYIADFRNATYTG